MGRITRSTITKKAFWLVLAASMLLVLMLGDELSTTNITQAQEDVGWDNDWKRHTTGQLDSPFCGTVILGDSIVKAFDIPEPPHLGVQAAILSMSGIFGANPRRYSAICAIRKTDHISGKVQIKMLTGNASGVDSNNYIEIYYRQSSSEWKSLWEFEENDVYSNNAIMFPKPKTINVDSASLEFLIQLRATGGSPGNLETMGAGIAVGVTTTESPRPPDPDTNLICEWEWWPGDYYKFGLVTPGATPSFDFNIEVTKVSGVGDCDNEATWEIKLDRAARRFVKIADSDSGRGDGDSTIRIRDGIAAGEYTGTLILKISLDNFEEEHEIELSAVILPIPDCSINEVLAMYDGYEVSGGTLNIEHDGSYEIEASVDHSSECEFTYRWLLEGQEIGSGRKLSLKGKIDDTLVEGNLVLEVSAQNEEIESAPEIAIVQRIEKIYISTQPQEVTGRLTSQEPCPMTNEICLVVNDTKEQTYTVEDVSEDIVTGIIREFLGNRRCTWYLNEKKISEDCSFSSTFSLPSIGIISSGELKVEVQTKVNERETITDKVNLYTVPWPLSVQFIDTNHRYCSGSVIDIEKSGQMATVWILTAAHCAVKESDVDFTIKGIRENVRVRIGGRDAFPVNLVGLDERLELALYKGSFEPRDLDSVYAASVGDISTGADIWAVGFPGVFSDRDGQMALTRGKVYRKHEDQIAVPYNARVTRNGESKLRPRIAFRPCKKSALCTNSIYVNRDGRAITNKGMSGGALVTRTGIVVGVHSSSSGYNQEGYSVGVSAQNWRSLLDEKRICNNIGRDSKENIYGFGKCEIKPSTTGTDGDGFSPPVVRIFDTPTPVTPTQTSPRVCSLQLFPIPFTFWHLCERIISN